MVQGSTNVAAAVLSAASAAGGYFASLSGFSPRPSQTISLEPSCNCLCEGQVQGSRDLLVDFVLSANCFALCWGLYAVRRRPPPPVVLAAALLPLPALGVTYVAPSSRGSSVSGESAVATPGSLGVRRRPPKALAWPEDGPDA
jgi:hypothetical protein